METSSWAGAAPLPGPGRPGPAEAKSEGSAAGVQGPVRPAGKRSSGALTSRVTSALGGRLQPPGVATWSPTGDQSLCIRTSAAGGRAARLRQTRPQFAGGPRRVRQASMSCSPVHTRVTVGNNQGQRWRGQWSGSPGPHPVLRPRACLLPFPPPRRRPGPWGARGTAPSPREAAGRPGPPPHPEGAGSGWGAPRARPRELRARVATGSDGDQCLPELRCSWAGTLSSLRVYGPSSQLVKSKDTVRSDGRERGARASAGLHLPTLRTRGF